MSAPDGTPTPPVTGAEGSTSGEPAAAAATPEGTAPAGGGVSALVVDHLTKRFGDRLAVSEVSFSLAAGKVFGFLDPDSARTFVRNARIWLYD